MLLYFTVAPFDYTRFEKTTTSSLYYSFVVGLFLILDNMF
jgi:hypothetical protein